MAVQGGSAVRNYYSGKLNAVRLLEVYQTGIERVRQYLQAEIDFVTAKLSGRERVLELGAGYGRIMREVSPFAARVLGLDISEDSVLFGKEYLRDNPNCKLEIADAHLIEYRSEFDVVLCLQNGLSAIKGDPINLVTRGIRALVAGGSAFFSTYSANFWGPRLEWFMEQADKGLLGEIDWERTGKGRIVCRDGFSATTFSVEDLEKMGQTTGLPYLVEEVDGSSLFLVIKRTG
jgi:2-polyprenyl-6-hydroxyphenyl methylase/3-demethylubiquinone-9 3-methyltransferase